MAYVPVQLWVPDTTEGPVTDAIKLKVCDECHALVPEELLTEHDEKLHQQEVNPQ